MDQNIIGLVLKSGGYPEPVTVSGCHGNQVKFKISISEKFLISPPSKNGLQIKLLKKVLSVKVLSVDRFLMVAKLETFRIWKF